MSNNNNNPSKLMTQLIKQQNLNQRSNLNPKKLEELYFTICKIQPNNLKFIELIILVLEKGLMSNALSLEVYFNCYEQLANKSIQCESSSIIKNSSSNEEEQKKFHKQKFIRFWTEMTKRLYLGNSQAYEYIFFHRLTSSDIEQNRMKLDQVLKKFINKEYIKFLLNFQESLQKAFILYLPENYNKNLQFTWTEAKLLDKKIPIICFIRMLYEAQLCPNMIISNSLLEMISKYIPPSGNNHKELIFYAPETISNYFKEFINQSQIKLIEGDIGLSFVQFKFLLLRLSYQFSKEYQQKGQMILMMKKMFNELLGIPSKQSESINIKKKTKFTNHFYKFSEEFTIKKPKKTKKNKTQKKWLTNFMQQQQEQDIQFGSNQCKSTTDLKKIKLIYDIDSIRRSIQQQTPLLPQMSKTNKQNQGFYNMQQKYVVIGQQLPKIQQKGKNKDQKQNKKQTDQLLGFKPQVLKQKFNSTDYFKKISDKPFQKRKQNQYYPILLSQIIYPKDLDTEDQLYIETAFISLADHNYLTALENVNKAKQLSKEFKFENQLFFSYIKGQIFQAMGKDSLALDAYYRCKQISVNLQINDTLRALPYCGLGSCLFHAEQFEYALRCFMKAKQIREIQLDKNSIEMANLYNNIGCCYMKLSRCYQARKFFELSHSILDYKLGIYHQKTLVVYQNLTKSKKSYVQRMPQFKLLWRTYQKKQEMNQTMKKKIK